MPAVLTSTSPAAVAYSPLAVVCRQIVKVFGEGDTKTVALNGVDLDVYPGQMTLLVGQSGCGKTTLISIIAGLLNATSGALSVLGQDLIRMKGTPLVKFRQKNIGFVFQQYNLLPTLTAVENAAIPLIIAGVPRRKALAMSQEILASVGLENRLQEKGLSG